MNIIDLATKTLQLAIQTAIVNVKTVTDAIKVVVDSTKTKVDTIDTRTNTINTNVNTANTNIGTPNTAANNAVTANSHAKLNWLTANVGTLIGGRVVKNVQRGSVRLVKLNSIHGEMLSENVKISSVNLNKSLVLINSMVENGGQDGMSHEAVASLSTSTNILVTGAIGRSAISIQWQVIEFY